MSDSISELINAWRGHAVVTRFDHETRTWIFISLHSHALGPCSGGTRMKVYPTPAAGLRDGMRLAEGMTDKWAALGLPYGGGKAVLASEKPVTGRERTALLGRYGQLIESLGGIFQTGEDLGTTTADLASVALHTRFVNGFDDNGNKIDPSPYTARGVLAGMKSALDHAFGNPDPAGRSVLIQGVGNVGSSLARQLEDLGARVMVSDTNPDRTAALADEIHAGIIAPEDVYDTACDVYAPCAVGATLNAESIPRLSCRIVAGSANNQLGTDGDAERLHNRGITYVPDFIGNAGGAYAFALLQSGVMQPEALLERVEGIGQTVEEILVEAKNGSCSSLAAAKKRVAKVLANAHQRRGAAAAS